MRRQRSPGDLVRVTVEVDKAALLRLPFPHIDQGDGTAILRSTTGTVPGVVLVRDEDRHMGSRRPRRSPC